MHFGHISFLLTVFVASFCFLPFLIKPALLLTKEQNPGEKDDKTLCHTLEKVDKAKLRVPDTVKDLQGHALPWANPLVQVWNSSTVTRQINYLLDKPVRCVKPEGTTYREVFNAFAREGCWMFLFGGSVRDVLRGVEPLGDLDGETSCSVDRAVEICEKLYPGQCWRSPTVFHIGGSRLGGTYFDAANWDETMFGDGSVLEFSANSLAYGLSEHVIYDVSGHGTAPFDVCNYSIKIPILERNKVNKAPIEQVNPELVRKWLKRNDVFRYWKLRNKGFAPVEGDNITLPFIAKRMREMTRNEDQRVRLQKRYCRIALEGRLDRETKVCLTENGCNTNQWDALIRRDFGDKIWFSELEPIVKHGFKCEFRPSAGCNKKK